MIKNDPNDIKKAREGFLWALLFVIFVIILSTVI
jgi:hypothetical protein